MTFQWQKIVAFFLFTIINVNIHSQKKTVALFLPKSLHKPYGKCLILAFNLIAMTFVVVCVRDHVGQSHHRDDCHVLMMRKNIQVPVN